MLIRGLVASGISLPSSGNSILIRKSIYFWQIQSKLAPPSDQKILWILSKEASLKEEKKIDTKMAVQTDPEGAPEPHVSWIPPSNFHPPAIKQPPPPSKKEKRKKKKNEGRNKHETLVAKKGYLQCPGLGGGCHLNLQTQSVVSLRMMASMTGGRLRRDRQEALVFLAKWMYLPSTMNRELDVICIWEEQNRVSALRRYCQGVTGMVRGGWSTPQQTLPISLVWSWSLSSVTPDSWRDFLTSFCSFFTFKTPSEFCI